MTETSVVDKKGKIEPSGDRFADVVDNVVLHEACEVVLHYAMDIAKNDPTDTEAENCVKVLKSLRENAASAIGDSIA